jgi:hypothetical protein
MLHGVANGIYGSFVVIYIYFFLLILLICASKSFDYLCTWCSIVLKVYEPKQNYRIYRGRGHHLLP